MIGNDNLKKYVVITFCKVNLNFSTLLLNGEMQFLLIFPLTKGVLFTGKMKGIRAF